MSWDVSYLAKICSAPLHPVSSGPFTSKFNKVHSPNLFKERCISEVVRIGSIIIRRLIKLWKAKFFVRCDVIFVVRLQEKFGIDHFGPTAPIITEFQSIRFLQMDSFRQKPTPSPAVLKGGQCQSHMAGWNAEGSLFVYNDQIDVPVFNNL